MAGVVAEEAAGAAEAVSPPAAEASAAAAREEAGDHMKPSEFAQKLDDEKLVAAIGDAEQKCSGEIRVYISNSAVEDPVAAAKRHFVKMGMTKTRERNGVLIFVAPRSRNFAIIGDEGIHAKCGQSFWDDVAQAMKGHLAGDNPTEALLHAIGKAASLLAEHFPRQADDKNELPDAIERGD